VGSALRGHRGPVPALDVTRDGTRLATAGEDGTARVWAAARRRTELLMLPHGDSVDGVAFGAADERLVTAGALEGGTPAVRIWDAGSGRMLRSFPFRTAEPDESINAAELSPDGESLLEATSFKGARVLDASTGRRLRRLPHRDIVYDVAYSTHGDHIVTASGDGLGRVWDARRGRPLVLRGHRGAVLSAAFSPDGRRVVTGSSDRTAIVWSASTGRQLRVLTGHTAQVTAARFARGGRWILTAGDMTVRAWDAASARLLGLWRPHASIVRDAAPAGAGEVASVGDDGTVRFHRCTTCVSVDQLLARAAARVQRRLTAAERDRYLHAP
jgi:WD40 repeat protein